MNLVVALLALASLAQAAVYTVSALGDSGPGSLREAIMVANANPGPDEVLVFWRQAAVFFPPSLMSFFSHTELQVVFVEGLRGVDGAIQLLSALPMINDTLALQGGGWVTLDGSSLPAAPASANGLTVGMTAINSTIEGLTVRGFSNSGVAVIAVGTTVRSVTAVDNRLDGISVQAVGVSVDNCTVCNNSHSGILVGAAGAMLRGNYVGITRHGMISGNLDAGVYLDASSVTIGGYQPQERNIVSGNTGYGIFAKRWAQACTIVGNYVGVDATGTRAVPNGYDGMRLESGGNIVDNNIVSGNLRAGIFTAGSGNTIRGNRIGTNEPGTSAIPNHLDGLYSLGSQLNVGGPSVQQRNIISGNRGSGLTINGADSWVENNYVGLDVTGTMAVGNRQSGFELLEVNITVINCVISGNFLQGIRSSSENSLIQGL